MSPTSCRGRSRGRRRAAAIGVVLAGVAKWFPSVTRRQAAPAPAPRWKWSVLHSQFVVASPGYCMRSSFTLYPLPPSLSLSVSFRVAINVSCIFSANFLIKMLFMHFSVSLLGKLNKAAEYGCCDRDSSLAMWWKKKKWRKWKKQKKER